MKFPGPGDSGVKQGGSVFGFSSPRLRPTPLIWLEISATGAAFTKH